MVGALPAWVERRESLRAREVFLLGTAMVSLSLHLRGNREFVPHPGRYFKACQGPGSILQSEVPELIPALVTTLLAAFAVAPVQVPAAVRAQSSACVRAQNLTG